MLKGTDGLTRLMAAIPEFVFSLRVLNYGCIIENRGETGGRGAVTMLSL